MADSSGGSARLSGAGRRTRPPRALPKPLSLAWYAQKILACIRRLRAALASERPPASLEAVVIDALRLGQYAEEAVWRFNRGDHIRQRVKVITRNRESARKRRPRGRSANDDSIEKTARRLRHTTPYASTKDHSTRWLAGEVARLLHISPSTARKRLTFLRIH